MARGTRTTSSGTWARFTCTRPDGEEHHFQLLAATATGPASGQFPPPCPLHDQAKLVRHGLYGTGARKRQRYRCVPADGSRPHTFTPPLPREAVVVGHDTCTTCEELLSPHRGTPTAARHTPWVLSQYARALNDLSTGSSYASVSMMMRQRRDAAERHLAAAHAPGDADFEVGFSVEHGATGRSASYVASQGKTAWHLAADLVEQYAPLLLGQVMEHVHARERALRAANDAALAADPDARLAAPLVYVLDEVPVYVKSRQHRQTRSWSMLVVVELVWHPAPTPMDYPTHENRLRLARVYPRADTQAWRLVLDELGTRPDYVVADCADAIRNAVRDHYAGQVGLIPSLFHVRRNLREGFLEKGKPTNHLVEGRRTLLPSLAKRLSLLDRDELLNLSPADWATWWDDLIAEVASLGAPIESLLGQRRVYETRMADAMVSLRRQPQLPASNAAVENRIRALLEPFLTNRKQLYRNLARTNFLLDLATCRAQGAFDDLDAVAHAIRDWNETVGGWAPAPRTLTDAQPVPPPPVLATATAKAGSGSWTPPRYSSLFNPLLVPALAQARLGADA